MSKRQSCSSLERTEKWATAWLLWMSLSFPFCPCCLWMKWKRKTSLLWKTWGIVGVRTWGKKWNVSLSSALRPVGWAQQPRRTFVVFGLVWYSGVLPPSHYGHFPPLQARKCTLLLHLKKQTTKAKLRSPKWTYFHVFERESSPIRSLQWRSFHFSVLR